MKVVLPHIQTEVLAVKLNKAGERSVRQEHPWIFSDSIEKINKPGKAGDICVIFSQKSNKSMGVGLLDPDSPIRIKMVHFGGGTRIDAAFFDARISQAFSKREPLLETNTDSYRLLFGESDGFPGLIADVYANTLVIKLYSAIWWPYLEQLLPILRRQSKCDVIVLRLSRNLQKNLPSDYPKDGDILYGILTSESVVFTEHGIRFSANVVKGHKTGYFLDHRHNRKRVGELAFGKSVLDIFSYAGGFSIHALVGGASDVTSVDISAQALEQASKNAALNSFRGKHHTLAGDAFELLNSLSETGKSYDLVIIDPPSFAKKATEVVKAIKKYEQLAQLGGLLAKEGGMLVLASCSSRVHFDEFLTANEKGLLESGVSFDLVETSQHDIDHPIGFPEAAYLKCAYYRIR